MEIGDQAAFQSRKTGKTVYGTVVRVNQKSYWMNTGEKWVKRRMNEESE